MSPFQQAVLVIVFWAPWHSRLALGDAGHLRGRGQCSKVVDDSGRRSSTGLVFLAPSRPRALCLLGLPDLSPDERPARTNVDFSAFHVCCCWIVCFRLDFDRRCRCAAFNAGEGCSGRSLSLQGRHESDVSVDVRRQGWRCCCLSCWVDSGFDIADAECGENRNSQARSHGGPSSGAEGYGPPGSVVSPSALGA